MERRRLDLNELVELTIPTEVEYRALYPRRYHPEVLRWADDQPRVPSLAEFLGRRRSRQADPTCIERLIRFDGKPLGTITAFGINRFTRDCELGVVIVDPGRWGRGIGGEAMRQFFALLWRVGIRTIHLETFVDNFRAQASFEKVGFTEIRRYTDPDIRREIIVMRRDLSLDHREEDRER